MSVTHRSESVLKAQKEHRSKTRISSTVGMTDGNLTLFVEGGAVCDGTIVKFRAPCNSDLITGNVQVRYTKEGTAEEEIKTFTCVNTMKEIVTGVGGAWKVGSMVSLLLDCSDSYAYIQNSADNDIDCGTFLDAVTLAEHMTDETAHSNLLADGNTETETLEASLQEHMVDESAHSNMTLDGNPVV